MAKIQAMNSKAFDFYELFRKEEKKNVRFALLLLSAGKALTARGPG